MTEELYDFKPDWVSPPGDTIADMMEERGWVAGDLFMRMGLTMGHISLLITGDAPITEDIARRLEKVLGSTADFWLRREAFYREELARHKEDITTS